MSNRMGLILEHYGAEFVPEGHGDRWRPMRCPFHDDRHASASYNEELDSFACLGCGLKGNAVTLLMMKENLDARDADTEATRLTGLSGEALQRSEPGRGGLHQGSGLRPGRRRQLPSRRSGRTSGRS